MIDILNDAHMADEYNETVSELGNIEMKIKGVNKAFSSFLVLWFLSKEDMHGYKIMKQIDYLFEPQIKSELMKKTKANNMYPLLKEMKNEGLLESYDRIHRNKEVKYID